MATQDPETARAADLWASLATVTDPELDEPITEMGFVERVAVTPEGDVEVDFRLPTYWCSPNFAFLMADGIRRAVTGLPWVTGCAVRLQDHCFADEVNAGVNGARNFAEIFAEMTDGEDLEALREKFREKAFLRRQETVLLALRGQGRGDAAILSMTLGDLDAAVIDGPDAAQKPRYRAALTGAGLARDTSDPAFVTWAGGVLSVENLTAHLQALRGIRINMEFNGALCRGLAKTRYKEVDLSSGAPELIDFILGRVPPRTAAKAAPAL